jgi:hypothetical protein
MALGELLDFGRGVPGQSVCLPGAAEDPVLLRADPAKRASHRSISSVVTDSTGIEPKAGRRWAWIAERYPRRVDGLRPRSCST